MHAVSSLFLPQVRRIQSMPNSLKHYLEATDGAGRIMAHARMLVRLRRIYEEIAPSYLQQGSVLANYKRGTSSGIVVIHACNGAIAAKLRQTAATLAEGFCKRGVECNEVRIKVQAPENHPKTPRPRQKPLSANAYGALTRLHDKLPEEETLRHSLARLLARCALSDSSGL